MKKWISFGFLSSLLLFGQAHASIENNKLIVKNFYDLAFNQHDPKTAALKYLTKNYLQHNPYIASGRQAFIEAFAGEKDAGSAEFIRLVAEGDFVVLHSHKHQKPGDLGVAGIDIFRVQNEKITEHWDVNQKIPEHAKNSMF
jgi:predicted SnoaL-like aldol condensation-catalyzing enzyme